jgi:hypothetical protein
MEFQTGMELWDWLVSSNPIVDMLLGELNCRATSEAPSSKPWKDWFASEPATRHRPG